MTTTPRAAIVTTDKATTTAGERRNRYRFYCRRGMKEVEEVLFAYLDRCYDQDDEATQLMFGRLLTCNDVDLFDWFIHRNQPDNPELAAYVSQLISRVAAG
jgi:antitoxin CptB